MVFLYATFLFPGALSAYFTFWIYILHCFHIIFILFILYNLYFIAQLYPTFYVLPHIHYYVIFVVIFYCLSCFGNVNARFFHAVYTSRFELKWRPAAMWLPPPQEEETSLFFFSSSPPRSSCSIRGRRCPLAVMRHVHQRAIRDIMFTMFAFLSLLLIPPYSCVHSVE